MIESVRNIGVGSTVLEDIESISKPNGVEEITIRMGLTKNNKDIDSTIVFLQRNNYTTKEPKGGGVDARKVL